MKKSNLLRIGPSCHLVFISKPIPTKYIIKTAGVQVESTERWKLLCKVMWNGVESMESIRNPGGIQVEIEKNLAGLPAKEITPGLQVEWPGIYGGV